MLLERRQTVVGAVVAAVLAAGTAWAVLLSAGALVGGDEVVVEFASADGLEAGDHVLVAGVRSGQVTDVDIAGDRVEVRLRTTAELPHDTAARVVTRNALGARAVRLEPGDDWDQLLTDGEARIPLERTAVSIDLPDLADETTAVLEDADADALTELVVALADVTEDQARPLEELLDGLDRVGGTVAARKDDLADFLADTGALVGVLNDADDDLLRAIDEVGGVVAALDERRGDLVALLETTPRLASSAADLLTEERDRIDRSLDEIAGILAIVDAHQVDVAHALAYGGVAFEGFASVGRSAGQPNPYWGNVLTASVGPIGTEALGGCGGVIDQVLDELLGPGPPCTGEEASRVGDDTASRDVLGQRDEGDASSPVPLLPDLSADAVPAAPSGPGALGRFLGGDLAAALGGSS